MAKEEGVLTTEEIRQCPGWPGDGTIEKKRVAARPAKKGVPNPFRPGELMDVKARPAYNKVKVRPLKNLKDMV